MSDTAKINLKIGQIEISIEGPSEFVSEQYDKIEVHLKTFSELSSNLPEEIQSSSNNNFSIEEQISPAPMTESNGLPDSFGEWLNKIEKGTSDTLKAILAGYFIQTTTAAKNFRVRDVSKILKEHGIKLSNPSTFLKGAVTSKKIFQVSKTGAEAHYKLTREAEEEMKQILTGK